MFHSKSEDDQSNSSWVEWVICIYRKIVVHEVVMKRDDIIVKTSDPKDSMMEKFYYNSDTNMQSYMRNPTVI